MPNTPTNPSLSTIATTTSNNITRWHCTECNFKGLVTNNLPPLYCVRPHSPTVATELLGSQDRDTSDTFAGETIYPGSLKTTLKSER